MAREKAVTSREKGMCFDYRCRCSFDGENTRKVQGALRGNSEVSREEENISVGSVPAGEGALVRKGSSSGAKQLRVWCSYHD